ncbi:hypothetical protein [Emcibacter sp.]|uniref:hypothetical protein n=1 Tax=Emcibacter sp. TaxID=1979954 RepID=UPI002AA61FE0|nr:hypothetical protein [Emcibacter sp.]
MFSFFRKKERPDFTLLVTRNDEEFPYPGFVKETFVSLSQEISKSEKEALVVNLNPPIPPGTVDNGRSIDRVVLLPLHQGWRLPRYQDRNFRIMGVMIFDGRHFSANGEYANIDSLEFLSTGAVKRS